MGSSQSHKDYKPIKFPLKLKKKLPDDISDSDFSELIHSIVYPNPKRINIDKLCQNLREKLYNDVSKGKSRYISFKQP